MRKNTKLMREQLEKTLRKFAPLMDSPPPAKGWIRAIRDALGMNGRQLADRLGDHRSRTMQIEQQEVNGSLTLKTVRRVADALDCVFVYCLVPRTDLEETVRNQAKQIALERLARASHTMKLENQALGKEENRKILHRMIEEIMYELPTNLWDE